MLGAMQQDAGKTPDAIVAFRQIADLDPSLGPRVEAQIVEAYKSAKDYKQARQEADSALKEISRRTRTDLRACVTAGRSGADRRRRSMN